MRRDRIGERRCGDVHAGVVADQARLRFCAVLLRETPRDFAALGLAAGKCYAEVIQEKLLHGLARRRRNVVLAEGREARGNLLGKSL